MTTPDSSESPNGSRSPWLVAGAAVLVAAGVVGIVFATRGSDDSADEAASSTSSSTTDPSADETTSTSDAATTASSDTGTSEAESVTTSTSTATTTTAQPDSLQYPNISNVAFMDGLALGWWDGSQWQTMPDGVEDPVSDPPVFAAQPVSYVDTSGQPLVREVSAMAELCTEFGNMWTVGDDSATEHLVGSSGDWDLRPRTVGPVEADDTHEQAVRSALEGQGITDADVRIEQVVRVDVDGDGTDEDLVSAEKIENTDSLRNEPPGSYSMVLLVRSGSNGPETVELASHVVTTDESDQSDDEFWGFIEFNRLVDVADLNGDGSFEAVIESGYYEGGSAAIYSLAGTAELQTGAGCGA